MTTWGVLVAVGEKRSKRYHKTWAGGAGKGENGSGFGSGCENWRPVEVLVFGRRETLWVGGGVYQHSGGCGRVDDPWNE